MPLNPSTHAVFRSALKQAFRWKLILANPADSVDLPSRNAGESVYCRTGKKFYRFIKAISRHLYERLFALAMTTGMRPSEYLALTWNDLDRDGGSVSISRTLESQKGDWRFRDAKRSKSRRMIKLQAWVLALPRKAGVEGRGLLKRARVPC